MHVMRFDLFLSSMFGKPRFVPEWEEDSTPLSDFINDLDMPQIVKIHEGENKVAQFPDKVDLEQPILLFKTYTSRKISARCVKGNERGELISVGPQLLFPDSYRGWMSIISNDGQTAGYFTSIGEVFRAGWPLFLSRDEIIGVKPSEKGLQRAVVSCGVVLKILGIYEDAGLHQILENHKGNVHPDLMMYLRCLTQQGDVIFLPFSTRGKFYCISTARAHTLNHVYLLSNLLRVTTLPALIRMICGPIPNMSIPLTDVLQLDEVRCETIILACTMINDEPSFMEINVQSDFSFVKAKNQKLLEKTDTYKRMHKYCVFEEDSWRQQIRVENNVFQKQVPNHMIPRLPLMPRFGNFGKNYLQSCSQAKNLPICIFIDLFRPIDRAPMKLRLFRNSERLRASRKKERIKRTAFDVIRGSNIPTIPIENSWATARHHKKDTSKQSTSDDGYATSFMEDESLYHSIC